jgi:hypothetical protein
MSKLRYASMSTEAADHSDLMVDRLSGRRLAIARMVCVTLVLLTLALFVVGLPALYNEYRTLSVFDGFGFDRSEVRANLNEIGLSTDFYAGYNLAVGAIFAMACYVTATIIFLRRSTEPIALLAVLTLVLLGANWSGATDSVETIKPFLGWLSSFLSLLGDATLLLFFYLFPNGRFVPRWTRWAAIIAVAYAVAVTLFSGLPFSSGHPLYWPALLALLFSGVVAQVYRYWRYSSIMERQQTKWVVFSLLTISKLSRSVIIVGDPYRKKPQRCPKTQPNRSRSPPSGAPQMSCGRSSSRCSPNTTHQRAPVVLA